MGDNDIKNMKVRIEDLEEARRIHFGERLCDREILRALLDFQKECPKEFKRWKKKKFKLSQ